MEKIREDIHKAKQRLEEVDKEAEALEEVIARGKTMTIIENKSDDSSEDEDESRGTGFINCITCGKVGYIQRNRFYQLYRLWISRLYYSWDP